MDSAISIGDLEARSSADTAYPVPVLVPEPA